MGGSYGDDGVQGGILPDNLLEGGFDVPPFTRDGPTREQGEMVEPEPVDIDRDEASK